MNESNDQGSANPAGDRKAIDEAARAWFLLITTGAPTEDERARFEDWRRADPRHQAAYAELQAVWDKTGELRDAFMLPEQAWPECSRADKKLSRPRTKTGHRRPALWASLAAACAAIFLLTAPDMALRLMTDHHTGVGEQARINLPDGSIIWLNTNSAISVAYSGNRRQVSLIQGEARFEAAKDSTRPFTVLARGGRATALGTVFSVRDDGAGAMITVSEGAVAVVSPAREGDAPVANTPATLLKPGEQARYVAGLPPGPARRVNATTVMAWWQGYISIKNRPLAAALAEIDRYRPGRILLLADPERLAPVTARLAIASLDDGLDALAATHGLSVTRFTRFLVIIR